MEQRIRECQLKYPYEAVTLRFQQLLGDFRERNFQVLKRSERIDLINRCTDKIIELYECRYFSTDRILVTSDSSLFLESIKKLPYVDIISGKMEHMDFTQNSDLEMNAKSFIDLFMLSKAKKITLLKTGNMYQSGFPDFAAEIGEIPFEVIEF